MAKKQRGMANDERSLESPSPRSSTWAPTSLGVALMAALPPHAAATWDGCHLNDAEGTPGYDAARVRSVEKREKDTWDACLKDADAILEATKQAPVKHLVDLAIVASALDMDGSLVERREVMAARALTRAVLGLAHVPESSCDLQALYERHERECLQNVNS